MLECFTFGFFGRSEKKKNRGGNESVAKHTKEKKNLLGQLLLGNCYNNKKL
jgi:hypothetical protein